ncbi:hypothetical protein M3Y97_00804800 [Aphelenchoides bicaudatus]|nr:hypothetical protein M3Y97_00804800 [Aphelenchoides bicaudatus]
MSNVEFFDLRSKSKTPVNASPKPPSTASTLPEIHSVRRSSSRNKHRRRRHKSSSKPRCREPNCEICRILKEDFENEWIRPKPAEEVEGKEEPPDRFPLTRVGLDPARYIFDKKTSQLDATINLLSQILDERLQAERYREAREISQTVRELIDKRQRADRLLLERRANLTDLARAQELKNEYDELIFKAVDMGQIRKHLTQQQASTIEKLKHF